MSIEKPQALQFRHNNNDGFVAGYDKEAMDLYLTKIDTIVAELKADYQDACDRLQTANLIKNEQKDKADALYTVLRHLVLHNLIRESAGARTAAELVKEYSPTGLIFKD